MKFQYQATSEGDCFGTRQSGTIDTVVVRPEFQAGYSAYLFGWCGRFAFCQACGTVAGCLFTFNGVRI